MENYKKELEGKLSEMNDLLKSSEMVLELIIVGGAAFILKSLVKRATFDIDFIKQTNEKAVVLLNNEGFDVNGRVNVFSYQFGVEWDTDLEILLEMSNLVVKTVSTERLMASRLFSNKRHEDFEKAIKSGKVSQKKFEEVFEDVYSTAYVMSTRAFKENAYMVKDLYKEKGWNYENSDIKHLCE